MNLDRLVLYVNEPDALAQFYTQMLGMKLRATGASVIVGYDGEDCNIELRSCDSSAIYRPSKFDRYWKIGISLPNIDIAYMQLKRQGVPVSEPRQFEDIGYLCHLSDPAGFKIELLQHTFQENRPVDEGDPLAVLGGGAHIGQISLRSYNAEEDYRFYCDNLGMRCLSVQPLTKYGFTLHFYAFTCDQPPRKNLKSVHNREWLWQRPYTTIEIQALSEYSEALRLAPPDQPGFAGIVVRGKSKVKHDTRDSAGGRVFTEPSV